MGVVENEKVTELRARVLLVDDDTTFRESTQARFQDDGYACDVAPDSECALKLLDSGDYDVVVTDLRMSGNRELEFIKGLRTSKGRPPVIVVTGYPSFDTAIEALDLRVFAYLVKPFEFEDLTVKIEQAVGHVRLGHTFEMTRSRLQAMSRDLEDVSRSLTVYPLGEAMDWVQNCVDGGLRAEMPCPHWVAATLTHREQELVDHLAQGYRLSTIARTLHISIHTVRRHLKSIFLKLEVRSQAELLEKLKPWQSTG